MGTRSPHVMADAEMSDHGTFIVRYFFRGEKARNGVLVSAERQPTGADCAVEVVRAIEAAGVAVELFEVLGWNPEDEGWCQLSCTPSAAAPALLQWLSSCARVDVMLRRAVSTEDAEALEASYSDRTEAKAKSSAGFFGIALLRSTSELNHGTLWRSASTFGANFMATIGAAYNKSVEGVTNTSNAAKYAPMWRFENWGEFCTVAPMDAPWVAIEMGGQPLDTFEHPPRAVYILGSESQGLPSAVVSACVHHVSIPAAEDAATHSLNVAVAGAIVMYDRLAKQRAKQAKSDSDAINDDQERF